MIKVLILIYILAVLFLVSSSFFYFGKYGTAYISASVMISGLLFVTIGTLLKYFINDNSVKLIKLYNANTSILSGVSLIIISFIHIYDSL